MNIWLVTVLVILFAILSAPLFVVFAAFVLYAFNAVGTDSSAIIIELYRIAETPMLTAIPLFVFAGYLLAESQAPKRMVALAQALFGWSTGGLAIVTIVACAFFTAFTGASGVTIIALGGMLFPILLKEGYPEKFSMGLVTASGNIGLLFPPSLPVILYGLIAQVSIDRLFLAGLVPGIILMLFLAGYSMYIGKKAKVPRIPFTWKNVWAASKDAAWEIPLPIVVIGGIYGGFFTATEAAAVTAFYVLVVEVFIVRDIHVFRDLPHVMRESMILVGATLSILGIAFGLTNYLVDQQIPQWLLSVVETRITSHLTFLLILNVFLLVIGMIMEMFPAILVVVPLILPIAERFGVNPLHLGIIFLTNLEVAYLVPPFGLNLFLSSLRFRRPVLGIARAVFVFLILEIAALLVITYVPEFSLGLLDLLGAQ